MKTIHGLKTGCILMFVLMLLWASGCMSVLVSGRAINPDSPQSSRYDGSLWSDDLWEPEWISAKSTREPLASVRVRNNYFYSLATVLTFGLYAPLDVEWKINNTKNEP